MNVDTMYRHWRPWEDRLRLTDLEYGLVLKSPVNSERCREFKAEFLGPSMEFTWTAPRCGY